MEPRGVLKLLTPMVAYLGKRQEQTVWANLKRFLETQQAPSNVGL